jgi:ribosomal protein S18 acetylase RimI-like enzyme
VELRKLNKDDLALYRALRMEAVTSDSRTLITTPEEEANKTDDDLLKTLNGQYVLGAFDGEMVLGMATLERHEGERRRHVAEVQWVFVCSNHRRRGIAKTLMEAIEVHAKSVGIECIELHVVSDNVSAVGMYWLLGYEEFGTLPKAVKIEQSYWDGLYMVKFLQ